MQRQLLHTKMMEKRSYEHELGRASFLTYSPLFLSEISDAVSTFIDLSAQNILCDFLVLLLLQFTCPQKRCMSAISW
jgi:hypothetical protein